MDDLIQEQLAALEKLLRRADDILAYKDTNPFFRKQVKRQRGMLNTACNVLHRALR